MKHSKKAKLQLLIFYLFILIPLESMSQDKFTLRELFDLSSGIDENNTIAFRGFYQSRSDIKGFYKDDYGSTLNLLNFASNNSDKKEIVLFYDIKNISSNLNYYLKELNELAYFVEHDSELGDMYFSNGGGYSIYLKKEAGMLEFSIREQYRRGITYVNHFAKNKFSINSYCYFTKINLKKGDRIYFKTEGNIKLGAWAGYSDPDGIDGYETYSEQTSFKHGALLGKIGKGNWFLIGSESQMVASTSGALFVMVNDNDFENNDGNYVVEYSINQPFNKTTSAPKSSSQVNLQSKLSSKTSNQNSAKTSNNIRTNDNIQKSKSNTSGVSVKNKPIKTEENQNSSYLENKQKESLNIKRIKDTIEARTKTYGPFPNKFSGTLHAFDTWINCELTLNIDSIGNLIISGSTNQNERFNFKWNLTQSKNSTNVFTGSVLHEYFKISQKVIETYPIRMDLSKINCCFIQGSCVMSKKDYLNQNGIYGDLVFRTYSNKNSLIKCFNEEIAILQTELKQSTLSRKERKKIESYIESKKEAIRNLDQE